MSKLKAITFSIILLLPFSAAALNFDNGAYGSLSDFFNTVFGPDPNAGLTAFPILKIPMGGRSEGLAGAFAAVSDDISFFEYNPAGSASLSRSEFALFHNNWIADTKIEGLAWASRYGDLGFGASAKWLYTPFSEYNIYGEQVSKGYYSEGTAILNVSYNFLSSFYFPGFAVGANLKSAFRIMPDYTDSDDLGNADGSLIQGSGLSQSAIMVMADAGILTRFNFLKFYSAREANTAAALVLSNFGPPSDGDALPSTMTAALSYKPLRPLMLSFDFSVPVNFTDIALSEAPYWSAGLSAAVTSFLSMRAGVMGKGGNFRVTVGSAISLEKISLDINYTLDLLTQMQPLNRVSLGVRFDLGDGGRGDHAVRVEELYLQGLDAYGVGNRVDALRYWEEALTLNPRYEPAIEAVTALRNSGNVQSRIMELQTLDN